MSDFIDDEFENQENADPRDWDWESMRQVFSSVLMVDVKQEDVLKGDDLNQDTLHHYIMEEAVSMYQARESLIPSEIMRNFERFIILRTIDENGKTTFMPWINYEKG